MKSGRRLALELRLYGMLRRPAESGDSDPDFPPPSFDLIFTPVANRPLIASDRHRAERQV